MPSDAPSREALLYTWYQVSRYTRWVPSTAASSCLSTKSERCACLDVPLVPPSGPFAAVAARPSTGPRCLRESLRFCGHAPDQNARRRTGALCGRVGGFARTCAEGKTARLSQPHNIVPGIVFDRNRFLAGHHLAGPPASVRVGGRTHATGWAFHDLLCVLSVVNLCVCVCVS